MAIYDYKGDVISTGGGGGSISTAPEPVRFAADMTDETKIYLYVGEESGYTKGDWYYYDGTAWVSGGAYGESEGVEPSDNDIPLIYLNGTLPTSKDDGEVVMPFEYKSKTATIKCYCGLKVQGDTSAAYAKRNFTLKLYEDANKTTKIKYTFKTWGERDKWVLKAHWMDCSHVRNVGTARIWGKMCRSRSDFANLPQELKSAPNNGATDGFHCKVFANGIYWGLYELIIPKDALFGQTKSNANHSILNSELNDSQSCTFATSTPDVEGSWKEELQDDFVSAAVTSFSDLITFVNSSTDTEFKNGIGAKLDIMSVIDFDIFARVFNIVDNLSKNQIFFTYDAVKWYEGAWDLDGTVGNPPIPSGTYYAYNNPFQSGYMNGANGNNLYNKVERVFKTELKARYAELRSGVLSVGEIISVYEDFTDVMRNYDGLLAEDYATTTANGAFVNIPFQSENNIQQIRTFISKRLTYMDGVINAL